MCTLRIYMFYGLFVKFGLVNKPVFIVTYVQDMAYIGKLMYKILTYMANSMYKMMEYIPNL